MFPRAVPLLQAAGGLERDALISNLVDMEAERSWLGPGDFALSPQSDKDSSLESQTMRLGCVRKCSHHLSFGVRCNEKGCLC